MEPAATTQPAFCEEEWMRLLFLLSDTEGWLQEMQKRLLLSLPLPDRKKLFRKTCYLTACALAHILERHYYRIPRHPHTGKFTISVTNILHQLRQGSDVAAEPIPGSLNYKRVWETDAIIGFDKEGRPTAMITVITDAGGRIVTAFPGVLE
ncbi:MAG: hypothetical protein ABW019_02495 [Chitinophagaceae bacterium]